MKSQTRSKRRLLLDVFLAVLAVVTAMLFWFLPGGGSPLAHGVAGANPNMMPPPNYEPPPDDYEPPPPQHSDPCAGYQNCTCVNGSCHGYNNPPPPPPGGNFTPPPNRVTPPPPARKIAPPPPAGNFAEVPAVATPAVAPTAQLNADMPAAPANSGPVANARLVADTTAKPDKGSTGGKLTAAMLMVFAIALLMSAIFGVSMRDFIAVFFGKG